LRTGWPWRRRGRTLWTRYQGHRETERGGGGRRRLHL
jgi:hypothetical protein